MVTNLRTAVRWVCGAALCGVLLSACLAERVDEALPEPTWAYIQPFIFSGTGHCTACHTGNEPPGAERLSLDLGKYEDLVLDGRISRKSAVDDQLIVNPGSSADSFLYRKITGDLAADGSEGARMPADGPPFLASSDVDLIAEWIDANAPP